MRIRKYADSDYLLFKVYQWNETDNINSSCISKYRTESRPTRQMRIRK